MNTSPYIRAPDTFRLQLPHTPSEVDIASFKSAFGATDESLCYYKGVLVGLVASRGRTSALLVNLLPKLDRQRNYPWPSDMQFQESMSELLRQAQEWSLVCERDCDQEPVPEVRGYSQLLSKLAEAYAYSKGEMHVCPTFKASARSLDV